MHKRALSSKQLKSNCTYAECIQINPKTQRTLSLILVFFCDSVSNIFGQVKWYFNLMKT